VPDKEMTQGTEKILQNPHFLLDCEINSRRNQYNKEGMELEVAETSEKNVLFILLFHHHHKEVETEKDDKTTR
jgi:hypothetical protein